MTNLRPLNSFSASLYVQPASIWDKWSDLKDKRPSLPAVDML